MTVDSIQLMNGNKNEKYLIHSLDTRLLFINYDKLIKVMCVDWVIISLWTITSRLWMFA